MNTRKVVLNALLALSLLSPLAGPSVVQAGSSYRAGTRGAHYRVTIYWQNRQGRRVTTAATVTYYWRGGLSASDRASLARHIRGMNSQGWRYYTFRYEHPRYFR